jgi:hypothetical protein
MNSKQPHQRKTITIEKLLHDKELGLPSHLWKDLKKWNASGGFLLMCRDHKLARYEEGDIHTVIPSREFNGPNIQRAYRDEIINGLAPIIRTRV